MDEEVKEALREAKERCEICTSLKKFLIRFSLSKEDETNEFDICLNCAGEIWPDDRKFFSDEILKFNSKQNYVKVQERVVNDITTEIDAQYPELYRALNLYLDGWLTMSDGNENQTLSDIYNRTVKRNKMPSEKQADLFIKIAGEISTAKNEGEDYKDKYSGMEVDNVISGIGVAKLDPKFDKPFEDIKKMYKQRGYVSHKQFKFLKFMRSTVK